MRIFLLLSCLTLIPSVVFAQEENSIISDYSKFNRTGFFDDIGSEGISYSIFSLNKKEGFESIISYFCDSRKCIVSGKLGTIKNNERTKVNISMSTLKILANGDYYGNAKTLNGEGILNLYLSRTGLLRYIDNGKNCLDETTHVPREEEEKNMGIYVRSSLHMSKKTKEECMNFYQLR